MQKFIVQKVKGGKTKIEQRDLMLPFKRAVFDFKEANKIVTLYQLPFHVVKEEGQDPFPDYVYAVFIDYFGNAGFILNITESEHFDGYEPFFFPMSNLLSKEEMEQTGWSDLDLEKYEDVAVSVINLILYVSSVCHRTSYYRKIQKKYEKHALDKDITNPKPNRQYLSGNVAVEWVDDGENDAVRKYIRHTEGWDVRGHYRHYKKSGKTVYVKPYHKGNPNTTTDKEFEIK